MNPPIIHTISRDPLRRARWTVFADHPDGGRTRLHNAPSRAAAMTYARLLAGWSGVVRQEGN